ncbi:MAG TPA: hypothetical protein VGX96_13160 [Candidatus Elarobacter sp.]|jgi:hypothetical protein|nr:hypothetical protein [Candidatus Elarobacter sp.]
MPRIPIVVLLVALAACGRPSYNDGPRNLALENRERVELQRSIRAKPYGQKGHVVRIVGRMALVQGIHEGYPGYENTYTQAWALWQKVFAKNNPQVAYPRCVQMAFVPRDNDPPTDGVNGPSDCL